MSIIAVLPSFKLWGGELTIFCTFTITLDSIQSCISCILVRSNLCSPACMQSKAPGNTMASETQRTKKQERLGVEERKRGRGVIDTEEGGR